MARKTLLLFFIGFVTAVKCIPCNEPADLLHGTHIFLQGRRLVQYVCNKGYHVVGRPLLSCSNGRWKGKPPICVGPGCPRPLRPQNAVLMQELNNGLSRYKCETGYELQGDKIRYCDGENWSGAAPTCIRITPEVPAFVIPDPPNRKDENAEDENRGIRLLQTTSMIRKPIFMDAGERSSMDHRASKSRILPLYKTMPFQHESNASGRFNPNLHMMMQRTLPRSPFGKHHVQPAPNPYQYPGKLPTYTNQRQQQNAYHRNYPAFRQHMSMYGGMFGQPFGQMPMHQNSLMSQRLRPPPLTNLRLRAPYQHRLVLRQDNFVRYKTRQNATRQSLINELSPRLPANGSSNLATSYFHNPKSLVIISTQVDDETKNDALSLSDSSKGQDDNAAFVTSGARTKQNRSESLVLPRISDVPLPNNKISLTRGPVPCPPPRKPSRGYHITRPLPKDYGVDEYLYYIEYHCLPRLVLTGGNETSFCMKNGRWTGKLPSCVKSSSSESDTQKEYMRKCSSGFIRDRNGICADIDECNENNGACSDGCRNFVGGYVCECSAGYILAVDGKTCIDLNECEVEGPCGHECHNAPGSFFCSCKIGYILMEHDNRTCLDVNECLRDKENPCHQACRNTFGSFECSCHLGYHLNGDGRTCSETCPPGYMLEISLETGKETCIDIDECSDSVNCSMLCVNTPGSFACSCLGNQILSEDGLSCIGCPKNTYKSDIMQRCIECPGNSITQDSKYAMGRGGCYCKPGFRGSPALYIPCTDIDECNDDNYGCSHTCVNTVGSVRCECPNGYGLELDGRNCQDIDECTYNQQYCGDGGMCLNVQGSYDCSCLHGYEKDPDDDKACVDINECSSNNGGCEEHCHNHAGGYRCSCSRNSRLDEDGKTCISTRRPCPALQQPENVRILPTVQCSQGMVNDGRVCLYTCYRGYKIVGQSRRLCRAGAWTGVAPQCIPGSWCPPIVAHPSVKVTSRGCSGGDTETMLLCSFSCKNPAHMMVGSNKTQCGQERTWDSKSPECVEEPSSPIPSEMTCSPLKTLDSGRILPSTSCVGHNPVNWGRICLYACQRGHRIVGPHRRMCRPGGWTGVTPKCVPKGWCPKILIPNDIAVYPSACAEHVSRPMLLCVFVCKHPSHIMVGNNATRCGRNREWDTSPPKCVGSTPILDSPAIPWIICPHDLEVDLSPGKSVANVTIPQPITNMNTIEQRSSGSTPRNTFPSGITRVRFTAFTDDRARQTSCQMQVHVRDKEPPVIEKCPGTLSLESREQYPKVSWEMPMFSDNVRVTTIKKLQHPSGNFTWGTYSISYSANDAVGNMAECTFTVRITRPKSVRGRPEFICGSPDGPNNGRTICQKWARGIYCIASCDSGYAFERRPSTYVCDDEGTWTPTNEVPDCISIRAKSEEHKMIQASQAPLGVMLRTNSTPLLSRHVQSWSEIRQESSGQTGDASRTPIIHTATELTFITNNSDVRRPKTEKELHEADDDQVLKRANYVELINLTNGISPKVKILSKQRYFRVPLRRISKADSKAKRSETGPSPGTLNKNRGQNHRPSLSTTDCPRGQSPVNNSDDPFSCIPCKPGTYRPRVPRITRCFPCSSGFYQDASAMGFCKKCPLYQSRFYTSQKSSQRIGLQSLVECQRYFGRAGF